STIPSSDLGKIGRKPQRDATTAILDALDEERGVPGALLLVHGPEGAGLAEFLASLESWRGWPRGARVKKLHPTDEDPARIAASIPGALGEAGLTEDNPFAAAIARRYENDCAVVILTRQRGWRPESFQNEFWRPLYDRLKPRWSGQKALKKFILVRVLAGLADPGPAIQSCDPAPAQYDWTRALALPRCGDLTERDIKTWLSDDLMLDRDRVVTITKEAIRGDDGAIDGTPLYVFERLRGHGFWDELAEREAE